MSLLKVNEVQNYNGSSLTLTASTVSTSAQLNTGGNVSVTGSINVSDDSTTRSNLGLGSIATQAADNVAITGGNISNATLASSVTFPAGTVINAGHAGISNESNKTTNFSTNSITLGTTSNTNALKSSTNKVLLTYNAIIAKISGGTTAYTFGYFCGGGLGETTSGIRVAVGFLYAKDNNSRDTVACQVLDTNPGSTTPSYYFYWDVDDTTASFSFENQKFSYIEIQG